MTMYLVKNVSGKVVTMPKTLTQLTTAPAVNNWGIAQTDQVEDSVIGLYSGHTDTFTVLAGPTIFNYSAPGTVPAAAITAGVTDSDTSPGLNKTILTLTNVSVTTTDATTAGAYGGLEIYDFPLGVLSLLGATTNLTLARVGTGLTATAAIVSAIGTATAGADATLTNTEADIIASTACTFTAGASTFKGISTAPVQWDGSGTAKKAFLNFAVVDAGSGGNDAILVNGTISLIWGNLGPF
jgi:hypothetical protein